MAYSIDSDGDQDDDGVKEKVEGKFKINFDRKSDTKFQGLSFK